MIQQVADLLLNWFLCLQNLLELSQRLQEIISQYLLSVTILHIVAQFDRECVQRM